MLIPLFRQKRMKKWIVFNQYRVKFSLHQIVSQFSTKVSQIYENGNRKDYDLVAVSDPKVQVSESLISNTDKTNISWDIRKYWKSSIQQLLPFGYPFSVKSGYGRFAACQFTASVFGTICSVLSMQSLLYAVGVGSTYSAPISAVFSWLVKDGIGQLGAVVFASVVNSKFDADPKRWRFIAAVGLDFSCFIELLTPLAPSYFIPIASIANVAKNISYLTASASKAAIHKSFAIHENMADVTVKTGSQTILASVIGTSIGISLAPFIGNQLIYSILIFCTCSFSGLTATYFSLNRVIIDTLTITKLDPIFKYYIDHRTIPSPRDMMKKEVFLRPPVSNLPKVQVGSDITEAVSDIQSLQNLIKLFEDQRYIINVMTKKSIGSQKYAEVHLLLKQHASKEDILLGLLHCYIARTLLSKDGYKAIPFYHKRTPAMKSNEKYVRYSQNVIQGIEMSDNLEFNINECTDLCKQLAVNSEWTIEEMHLETRRARISIS